MTFKSRIELMETRCRVCGKEWAGCDDVCDHCVIMAFRERMLMDAVDTITEALKTCDSIEEATAKLEEIKADILKALTKTWR